MQIKDKMCYLLCIITKPFISVFCNGKFKLTSKFFKDFLIINVSSLMWTVGPVVSCLVAFQNLLNC